MTRVTPLTVMKDGKTSAVAATDGASLCVVGDVGAPVRLGVSRLQPLQADASYR